MALMTWSDSLSVGVREFDDQHKKLISLVNQLHEAMAKGQGKAVLGPTFSSLIQYTLTHFAAEERQLTRTKYPDLAAHKMEHEALTTKAKDLKARFDNGQTMLTVETMNFLKSWLVNHIQGTDKKYGAHLNANNVN